MIVLDTPYLICEYEFEKKRVTCIWNLDKNIIKENVIKKLFLRYMNEVILAYEVVGVLHDLNKFYYTISPEMQDWINENVNKVGVEKGVKNVAMLVSPDLFSQISVELTMNDGFEDDSVVKYFDSEGEALKWLNDKMF